ncbi:hypothetical protein WJX72_004009 [[Myrmecia] bisecta]|uniref:Uncharacterized protein n=1 Tax=[Myrmecia] bisecta TaxID=41462 RepID=A0AAW1QET2_9CHLO
MSSAEKVPLKFGTDEKARNALNNLSSSLAHEDVEAPSYLSTNAPKAKQQTLADRIKYELTNNWWLWGAIIFSVLLIGGLVTFRSSLYSTAGHGLPSLAVKENAGEACATECQEAAHTADLALHDDAKHDEMKSKEAYEICYNKCVADETKEVAEEREKFKAEEEALEREAEEKDKEHEKKEKDD